MAKRAGLLGSLRWRDQEQAKCAASPGMGQPMGTNWSGCHPQPLELLW